MEFFVYILYSDSAGKFYKGQSNNVIERLRRHNNGLEISTKHDAPWQLVWLVSKATRSEAIILETKLKNLGTKRLKKFMLKYPDGFPDEEALKKIELLTN